jgi:hypothetical protein
VLAAWSEDGRGSVLQALKAGLEPEWQHRLDDRSRRLHVQAPYHATPVLRAPRGAGSRWLAALAWAGRDRDEAEPWRVRQGSAGRWVLEHARLDPWVIEHWALPEIDL